jgi:hypothetical protein
MLRDIKRVLEGGLLGGNETKATDVSGPPTGVLAHGLGDSMSDVTAHAAQRMGGSVPVDPNASTDPGAARVGTGAVPADHEVFFMNRVADTTQRLPSLSDPSAATPTVAGQVPTTLPLNAPTFDPALLAQQTQPLPTHRMAPPAWVSSQHSVEPVASRTQPESTEPGRRESRRGRIVFVAASLFVCVGVLGIAASKTFLHRSATQPAAASMPAPSVSLAATEVSAASSASSAPSELPSASATAPAASSGSPAPPRSPPVVPVRPRPGSSNASPVGERPSSGL